MAGRDPNADVGRSDNVPLCPSCFEPNDPGAHACKKCGAPLDLFATTDPLQLTRSAGWAYRQATSGRRTSKLILIAMWLIFGPAFLLLLFLVLPDVETHPLGLTLFLLLLLLNGAILYRVTKSYRRRRNATQEDDWPRTPA